MVNHIMDRSLKRLMRINRGRFFNLPYINPPSNPDIPDNPDNPPSSGYTLSDFGENAINNHRSSDASHASKVSTIFNYIIKDFSNRCTTYMSYDISSWNGGMIDKTNTLLCAAEVDADIIMTPYVSAASYIEYEYHDFVLPVSSHYDNAGTDGDSTNSNRHDITANAETLLINSVAVSARRDAYESLESYTSYGYGMEFFEDISPEAMDSLYPNKDIPSAFAELLSEDGINLTSNVHLSFSQYVEVGQAITIRYTSEPATWQTAVVSEIVSPNHIRVATSITPITTPSIYGWRNVTLATYCGGQAQSWAVPLVAGKLKVIKMTTLADWDTVRAAARATAKRNPTGIPEIDNSNWDMYRGFGCIDVQAAIQYINNL